MFDSKGFLKSKKSQREDTFYFQFTKTIMFTYWMDIRNLTGEIAPDLILFEKATKLKKSLRNTRMLKRPLIKTLMETIPPNRVGLKQCNFLKSVMMMCDVFLAVYSYTSFPKLDPGLFTESRVKAL